MKTEYQSDAICKKLKKNRAPYRKKTGRKYAKMLRVICVLWDNK